MWCVERIVCGDGSVDNSGITLKENKFYGCGSTVGGHESFHLIEIRSLKLFQSIIYLPFSSDGENTLLHPKKNNLTTSLKEWCEKHKGTIVDISGPGKRGKIENSRQHQSREFGPVMMVANFGNCAVAALVNGIHALRGEETARRAMDAWKSDPPRIRGLKQVSALLYSLSLHICVEKIPKQEREEFHNDTFKWLSKRDGGVWIVRVEQKNMVDHVVVIDGNRGIVLDSADRYPFILSQKILTQLGGTDCVQLRVAEVRKLVNQRFKSSKRGRDW